MAAARGRGGPIEATSLANEAVCRLLRSSRPPKDAEHLKAMAAQSLGWLLTDRLRARGAARRREQDAAIDSQAIGAGDSRDDHSADVAAALEELSGLNTRAAEVFVLAALAEMAHARIGEHLGIDERTVRRDFRFARAFLAARCAPDRAVYSSESAP
jgi:RNA polymerase sigma factor (sigma-70 family)